MSRTKILAIAAVALILGFGVNAAQATLIWDGDASRGTGVFASFNCGSPGSVTAADDSAQGRVWRFYKPSGSNRCENHGISVSGSRYVFGNGNTYYIGWRNKLTSTVNNNANFQWKSYGNHIQNYPVLLKMISNRITLQYRAPNESCCRTLWSAPVSTNTWNHQVLALHLSSSATSGWIEFWYNGTQQTLAGGVTRYPARTLDDINEPKWGVYGAESTTVSNYIDGLRVGTTYADVSAGGPTPTPTPTPTPGVTPTPAPGGGEISFEAENVSYTHSGTGVTVQTDANCSGGRWISLDAENTGSWFEFTTPSIPAGTYSLRMSYKTNNNRGQLTMRVDGTQVGGTLDQYGSPSTYPTVTFGTVTFGSTGTHKLRMAVAGKSSSSSNYVLSADKFTLQ